MAAGRFCSGDDLLICSVWSAEFYIVFDGISEQVHILKNHADISQQTVAGKGSNICSAKGDRSAVHIIEPGDQVAQRRFSAARWPDDGSCCILRNGEIQIMQNHAIVIAEGHVLKFYIIRRWLDIRPILIDILCIFQCFQLVHG